MFSLTALMNLFIFSLRYLFCSSDIFNFSMPNVVGLLGYDGDILSWLSLVVYIHWYLGIWVWDDCNYRCCYLVLSLLGRLAVPWLLFPLWNIGVCGDCGWSIRAFLSNWWCGHWVSHIAHFPRHWLGPDMKE